MRKSRAVPAPRPGLSPAITAAGLLLAGVVTVEAVRTMRAARSLVQSAQDALTAARETAAAAVETVTETLAEDEG